MPRGRGHDHQGRSKREARHIRLYHWLLDTPAWKDLDANCRCIYLELLRRYNGSNNGRIPLSVREIADQLRIGSSTASRALRALQAHGFIAVSIRGRFERRDRHATQWRLTEFACNATGELPTKEFTRWRDSDGAATGTLGATSDTLGSCDGTVGAHNPSDGSCNGTVERKRAA
jgi:DNA-binding transcriptional ArsR family regulator